MRLLKCYGYCSEKYPKDELINFKNKNYCKPCYQKRVKEIKDRNTLYETIKERYRITYPTGMMLAQIKDFTENRGYSLSLINYTINYIADYKRNIKLNPQYGLSIIPHIIDEAKLFLIAENRNQKSASKIKEEPIKISVKETGVIRNNGINKLISMEDF